MIGKTVAASGPTSAKIMFVGMGPAREEIQAGVPFVGPAGRIFNKSLAKLGESRDAVYITNISDQFLAPGTSLFSIPTDIQKKHLSRLATEIRQVQPHIIVPLGDEPLYFLTGLSGITKWRGSIVPCTLVPGIKCIPTIHPAWILRGMWKWESVFTYIDLRRAFYNASFPEIQLPERNAITGPSVNTILEYIAECQKQEYLSFDIETFGYRETGLGQISCIGIGYKPTEALCIPFTRSGVTNYLSLQDEMKIWPVLARLLENPNIKKIGQNIAFDWIYMWAHKIYPANLWIDTMDLHHTLYPDWGQTEDVFGARRKKMDEPGHGLAFIVSQYCDGISYYKDDGRKWIPTLGDHRFWEYNCKDVMNTMHAAFELHSEAIATDQWNTHVEWKVKPFLHKLRAEWFGVAIDISLRQQAGMELKEEIDNLQTNINEKVGFDLNVNSPKQLADYLYKQKGYAKKTKVVKLKDGTKARRITTDKHAMRELQAKSQDEILWWIEELRAKRHLKSELVDQELDAEGRMHTHFGVTDTLRWTSSKSILGLGTNMQNIPTKGIARKLFIPD